jgi:ribosomal protein L16 Arg81 hydroxylase
MACRRGAQHAESPTSAAEARRLHDDGHTILVRHAEKHDRQLGQLAEAFARDLGGKVDVHVYATPAEQYGFGWHYDAEDVFILQTVGSKEYSLRKNTVHPWPLIETIPADMRYEREIMPLMRCLLAAGDRLYIPNGYWHMGAAREPSISLAIGVLSPAAIDIHDFAKRRLTQSLVWRQRLPVSEPSTPGLQEQRREEMREILKRMAREATELYESDEFLDAVLEHFSR